MDVIDIYNVLNNRTIMKKIRLGTNFAVFVIFFGIAVLESFTSRNWLWVAFWVVMGVVFIIGDNIRKRSQ